MISTSRNCCTKSESNRVTLSHSKSLRLAVTTVYELLALATLQVIVESGRRSLGGVRN